MTPADLKVWQVNNGYTYESAAKALGVSRATYARYLKYDELPRYIVLACLAINHNLHK